MNYSGATSSRQPLSGVRSRNDVGREQTNEDATTDFIEFVESSFNSKNWRGVFIALLVIGAICGLIILTIIFVTPEKIPESILEKFTLDDLFSDQYQPRHCHVRWSTDRNVFRYRTHNGDLVEVNADENRTTVILQNFTIMDVPFDKWFDSNDGFYVLLATQVKTTYSHSYSAKYEIHQRNENTLESPSQSDPTPFPCSHDNDLWHNVELQYAGWAPTGHALVFVYKNNIYYQSNPATAPVQLTTKGLEGSIYNGIPDWLYEEEILHSNVALWWSPDGRFIAYLSFNDTGVPSYRYPIYGPIQEGPDTTSSSSGIQVDIVETPYPKAGDERNDILPIVSLFVIDTTLPKTAHRQLDPPQTLANQDHYITLVRWRNDSHVMVAWSNRAQNRTVLTLCSVISTDCHQNHVEEKLNAKGWVIIDSLTFIEKGEKYLTILPRLEANTGFWRHVALVTSKVDVADTKIFVTHGAWDVTEIVGYDSRSQAVYYIATKEDPKQRHLYRSFIQSGNGRYNAIPECLTCSYGDTCRYLSAQLSPSAEYYVEGCLGPEVPVYTLKELGNQSTVLILEDNSALRNRLKTKALPIKEFFQFDTDSGYNVWGQLQFPPNLKKDNVTTHPLLVYAHAAPGTQLVTDEFRLDWSTYLASSHGIVVASFDGRGSGGRGERFLHEVYRRLGTVEVQDQIKGASHVVSRYPFIRKDHLAVWGEGYGGFVVTHILGDKDDTLFTCGIAVSPITDWKYYDVAYAERLMGSSGSRDNYRGYDLANASSKSDNFRNKSLLLIHGSADDKVHVQHSAQLSKALTTSGVDFKFHLYTDEGRRLLSQRSIVNGRMRRSASDRHGYRTMEAFLHSDCWMSALSFAARKTPASPSQSSVSAAHSKFSSSSSSSDHAGGVKKGDS